MQVLELSSERFQKQAENCLKQASAAADPGYRSLWYTLALDCLRLAAAIPESKAVQSMPMRPISLLPAARDLGSGDQPAT
jgi:hypothetical protein